jgi:predicted ATPase
MHDALTQAQRLSHPLSLALALVFASILHQFRRESQMAQERAEAAITLSTEQGFAQWSAWGTHTRGWALAEQGQAEEGIAQMRQGLAAYQATGAESFRPHHLALLTEGYRTTGQADEGLAALVEALAFVDKTGERFYEAELYRLKGELTLQQQSKVESHKSKVPNTQHPTPSTQAEAEACFHKAIEIARKQQAKSLELRAATSLARLWQQQGKKQEARQLLAETYGWFTEGFDTVDLQEAKALLAELEDD